jgi:hypothetical protein
VAGFLLLFSFDIMYKQVAVVMFMNTFYPWVASVADCMTTKFYRWRVVCPSLSGTRFAVGLITTCFANKGTGCGQVILRVFSGLGRFHIPDLSRPEKRFHSGRKKWLRLPVCNGARAALNRPPACVRKGLAFEACTHRKQAFSCGFGRWPLIDLITRP